MAFDRFLIAPYKSGLRKDLASFLIPEDAFTKLNNAYVFRGKVKKRFGSDFTGSGETVNALRQLRSRVRINLGNTDGSGDITGTVPGAIFKIGQMFSIGTEIFTVQATGTPVIMLTTGAATTHTYNTTTGIFDIQGAAITTACYFYPSEPIMGLTLYEYGSVNEHTAFAFDTQYVYKFTGSSWSQDGPGATTATYFHGDNKDFFWTCNWTGLTDDSIVLFVTNFQATLGATPPATDDNMYYYDGTNWTNFSALTKWNSAEDIVKTARIIIPFKNRLLLLNTIEQDIAPTVTNTAHTNRCRYSHNGSPLAANAWLEPNTAFGANNADGAGYIDAPTEEEIVSAAIIKDRLIIYFERSTWELVYTHNESLPFVWQSINSSLGSEATFSTIPFDKSILTVGTTGIHACNGANVQRIDEEIPDEVFELLKTTSGTKTVHGVKDYFSEMVYWTFRNNQFADYNSYPDKILVYNYQNGTWALNDDCFTAFGYFEQGTDLTWEEALFEWEETNETWTSYYAQANSRTVIAGNHQGFVLRLNSDKNTNAQAMQISDMSYSAVTELITITCINHNLLEGEYIKLSNVLGFDYGDDNVFQVFKRVDANTITVDTSTVPTGTYIGGGLISRVSRIEINSKDWNPYLSKGFKVYISKASFCVDKTSSGEVEVNYATSSTSLDMIYEALNSEVMLGNNILETHAYDDEPIEATQDRLWHDIYFQSDGNCFMIKISLNDLQMRDEDIVESDFILNGVVLFCKQVIEEGL